jgi:hypothetical protein
MKTRLQKDLAKKEEALEKLQENIEEYQEEMPTSIVTIKANTMTETTLVSSPSFNIPQENIGGI